MKKRCFSFVMALFFVVSMQVNSVQAAYSTSRSLVKLNAVYSTSSLTAVSNTSTVTVGSSTTTRNKEITSVVITSTKSSTSTGDITMYVKNTTTGYSDSKPWARTLTFTGLNGSSPIGSYQVYFTATRKSAGSYAAATINTATIKINYE